MANFIASIKETSVSFFYAVTFLVLGFYFTALYRGLVVVVRSLHAWAQKRDTQVQAT